MISTRQADLYRTLKRPMAVGDRVRVNALGLRDKKEHESYKQMYATTPATIKQIEGDKAWIVFDTDLFFFKNTPMKWRMDWLERA